MYRKIRRLFLVALTLVCIACVAFVGCKDERGGKDSVGHYAEDSEELWTPNY